MSDTCLQGERMVFKSPTQEESPAITRIAVIIEKKIYFIVLIFIEN